VGKTKEFLSYPDTLLNTHFHCYTWLCSHPSYNSFQYPGAAGQQ